MRERGRRATSANSDRIKRTTTARHGPTNPEAAEDGSGVPSAKRSTASSTNVNANPARHTEPAAAQRLPSGNRPRRDEHPADRVVEERRTRVQPRFCSCTRNATPETRARARGRADQRGLAAFRVPEPADRAATSAACAQTACARRCIVENVEKIVITHSSRSTATTTARKQIRAPRRRRTPRSDDRLRDQEEPERSATAAASQWASQLAGSRLLVEVFDQPGSDREREDEPDERDQQRRLEEIVVDALPVGSRTTIRYGCATAQTSPPNIVIGPSSSMASVRHWRRAATGARRSLQTLATLRPDAAAHQSSPLGALCARRTPSASPNRTLCYLSVRRPEPECRPARTRTRARPRLRATGHTRARPGTPGRLDTRASRCRRQSTTHTASRR